MNPSLSLYLHIPFCRYRCSYCDFNTYTSIGDLKEAYAAALCQEIEQVGAIYEGEKRPSAHTVFFGGGTPSLMATSDIKKILGTVRGSFALSATVEISMEANPGTVDEAYLAAVKAAGINRLSFGVQSAVASELALLEREHDFAAVEEAVRMSRAVGLDNFNLDLIYGVPGQTLASWEMSLQAVLALRPSHLSCYCLTIEPGTPMQRWLENDTIALPDPDLAADQYALTCQILAENGYDHYEISNWSLPGQACQHNLTYWRNLPYLGLGAGAHGFAGGYRYAVVKQPRSYIRRLTQHQPSHYPLSAAVANYHLVDAGEGMSDVVITQLRLLHEGLDLAAFEQTFGQSLAEAFGETVNQLVGWGLLEEENGRLLLTQKGWFLSNQVFYRFM